MTSVTLSITVLQIIGIATPDRDLFLSGTARETRDKAVTEWRITARAAQKRRRTMAANCQLFGEPRNHAVPKHHHRIFDQRLAVSNISFTRYVSTSDSSQMTRR